MKQESGIVGSVGGLGCCPRITMCGVEKSMQQLHTSLEAGAQNDQIFSLVALQFLVLGAIIHLAESANCHPHDYRKERTMKEAP